MATLQEFHNRIERFSGARRAVLNAESAFHLGALALAVGVASLVLLAGWLPNAFLNFGLFLLVGAVLLGLLVRYVRVFQRFHDHLPEVFMMEALAGGLNSRMVSAVDFLESQQLTSLTQSVIARAADDLAFDFEARLDRASRDLWRKRFLLGLIVFVGLGFTPWFHFQNAYANLRTSAFAVYDHFFPVVYTVSPAPGQHVYGLGETVELAIAFGRRGYRDVTLMVQESEEQKAHLLTVGGDGRAVLSLSRDKEAELSCHFKFGRRQSAPVNIVFTTKPVIEHMQTELVYPTYTRMLPRSMEGVQRRIVGLPGSKVTIGMTFSKELLGAALRFDDGESIPLEVSGRSAWINLIHNEERHAQLQVEDIHGFSLANPFELQFGLLKDERPRVFLQPRTMKKETGVLDEQLALFTFGARLEDDYGVARAVLKWQKATVENPTEVTDKGEIERLVSPAKRKTVVAFEKVFESLAARPGDRITFKVEVFDNRQPAPQKNASRTYALFVYQAGLAGVNIKQLGFGSGKFSRARVNKVKRAKTVKSPMGSKTIEKVVNEHEAKLKNNTRAPQARGAHRKSVNNYFKLLKDAVYTPKTDGK